jgi:hypothetical protein
MLAGDHVTTGHHLPAVIYCRGSRAGKPMAAVLDPLDLEALERSLNDSAVRVSTIWVSFLVFGLYLAIAAGGVTPLQLFLAGAGTVKLPLLYTDLTVFSFFLIAPVLFVIFHLYLLIQVLLLRRTADAYNEAVDRNVAVASDRAHIRQRLANTLFAQMFAGSPREREGPLGMLLRFMASATLAILPVLLLLLLQIWFLPYQSGFVTLTHRLLILVDLMMVLILWRGALEPRRDIGWRLIRERRVPLLSARCYFPGLWCISRANCMRDGCGSGQAAAAASSPPISLTFFPIGSLLHCWIWLGMKDWPRSKPRLRPNLKSRIRIKVLLTISSTGIFGVPTFVGPTFAAQILLGQTSEARTCQMQTSREQF